MSNWDDEDWDDSDALPHPVAAASPHAPAGDWDDEDEDFDEEEVTKVAHPPPAPMKPKKALENALRAKEEAERSAEVERIQAREKELAAMSLAERKAEQQKIVEEADLENAKDLFLGDGNGDQGIVPENDNPTIDNFQPESDADFEKLANMIGERVRPFNKNPRRTGRYVQFVKHLMRSVTKDLGADDVNELSTFVGLLSNEKRDEFKRSKGIKKKTNKKTSVRVDKASDLRSDRFDDFADDFM